MAEIEWEFNCKEYSGFTVDKRRSQTENILDLIVAKARELKEITGREPTTIFMSVDIASTIVAELYPDECYGSYSLTRIGQYEVKITRGTNELYVGYEILEKKGE